MDSVSGTWAEYRDEFSYCAAVPALTLCTLAVFGEVNSAGSLNRVNDHASVIILGRNAAGYVSIIDSLGPNTGYDHFFNIPNSGIVEYSALAIPQSGHSYLAQNNLPTYLGNTSSWQSMTWVSDTVENTHDTIFLQVASGTSGSGSGNVSGGSARSTTGGGDPVEGMLMIITDLNGELLSFQFTDSDGDFEFDQLGEGEYRLFSERLGKILQPNESTMSKILDA